MSRMNNPAEIETGSDDWWTRPTYASKASRSRNDYVSDLWSERGWSDDESAWSDDETPTLGQAVSPYFGRKPKAGAVSIATSTRAVTAHGMVQTFVDTFSASDYGYRVTFDPTVSTAGTDFEGKRVVISPAPVFDPSLTARECGLILTAMAVHEVSHIKYGQNTAASVTRAYSGSSALATARRLSNILDDVRIEQRFSADYPGYADVFAPTLEYVARPHKGTTPRLTDPVNFAVGAIRYAAHLTYDTPELVTERDWWIDWAHRGAAIDGGKHHVAAIREAIAHIGTLATAPTPSSNSESNSESGSESESESESGSGSGSEDMPTCSTDGVAQSASASGVNVTDLDKQALQNAVEEASTLEGDPEYGKGQVLPSPNGLPTMRNGYYQSSNVHDAATATIRAAFARSRSGRTDVQGGKRHGRLSGHDLPRIAMHDDRLFAKRTAPSVGKFLVWVMVDCSSSMAGSYIRDAASVAQAFVEATAQMGNVRSMVWGWSSAFDQTRQVQGMASFGAVKVYEPGRQTSDVMRLTTLPMGGTPDASTLAWAVGAIDKAKQGTEQPIILMVSDGQGYSLTPITDKAARKGVRVIGVNIDDMADESRLRASYGPGNYTTWPGSIAKVARPLGLLIGKAITPKAR